MRLKNLYVKGSPTDICEQQQNSSKVMKKWSENEIPVVTTWTLGL